MEIRIKAKDLKVGDKVITGETVVGVGFNYTGTAFERSKVYLHLDKNGKVRYTHWNKSTEITVERNQNV